MRERGLKPQMSHRLPPLPPCLCANPKLPPARSAPLTALSWGPRSWGLSRLQPPWNPSSPHEDGTDRPLSFGASCALSLHVRAQSDLVLAQTSVRFPDSCEQSCCHCPWVTMGPPSAPPHALPRALHGHCLSATRRPRLAERPALSMFVTSLPPDPSTLFTLHPAYCPLEFFLSC